MKKISAMLVGCLSIYAFSGTFLPASALLVNEKGSEIKVDPTKNGYLGFAFYSNFNSLAKMDLKEIASGEKYRITMNPEFGGEVTFFLGPIAVAGKKIGSDTLLSRVILHQLPAGRYVVTYFYPLPKNGGFPVSAETLAIETGKVLSIGELSCRLKLMPIFQVPQEFEMVTSADLPDSFYNAFGPLGISKGGLVHRRVKLTKE